MTVRSDPQVRPVPVLGHRAPVARLADSVANAPVARARSNWHRALSVVGLTIATYAIVLQMVTNYFAGPLRMSAAGGDPNWIVEVTATGTSHTTALVFGPDIQFGLYRVPPRTAQREVGRALPFPTTHGEVHVIAMGWSALHVQVTDRSTPLLATRAESGRWVTAYEPNVTTAKHQHAERQ